MPTSKATAQLSQRAKALHCRGLFGAFDVRAVDSALQNLLTRPRPLIPLHAGLPVSTVRVGRRPTLAPSVTYGPLPTGTAFLREISEGTSH